MLLSGDCQCRPNASSPASHLVRPHCVRFGRSASVEPQQHAVIEERYCFPLHISDAMLTFPQTLLLRYTHCEPAERKQPQVVEDGLCVGRFTWSNIVVAYALMLASHWGLDAQFTPAVVAYWARLQQRAAFQNALDQGVPTTPSPDIRPDA